MAIYLANGYGDFNFQGTVPLSDISAKLIELTGIPDIVRVTIWEPGKEPIEDWVLSFGVWQRICV